ncbi:endolytic transglycosylase MltG [Aquabacterium sp. OR-4]|uniref:endolytic transglycosylase MltG n=1 Tax=Aquabacterium sp. OR-4 TaxID=2978127 RepID=UPI0021B326F6|nr:endolytic transglycosylase MltG [Aquabacterium sp. OR-4]MDT7834663.1 endolytic transglycosylase MltG [Aquabacterium sp. OR-4]
MKLWRVVLVLLLLAVGGVAGGVAWWLERPLPLAAPAVELSIEPGMSPREVAAAWVRAGVQTPDWALYQWFRASGQARRIRAGSYEVEPGITPRGLLGKMVQGDESYERVRLIEGWSLRQFRAALAKAPHLKPTTAAMSDAELLAALQLPALPGLGSVASAEGRFFPDTYLYSRGVSDLTVLRRAALAMQRQLDAAWARRAEGLPISTPGQALVLASIVEKETGQAADRGRIAGVFVNRLKIGMPLQTDPSVIYGLGEAFDGNLRKRDLQADTPWNTYTRRGLPPTPIAMPGLASLRAAVQPEATRALYFVARGDGSSIFSEDLGAHNRAVNQYQRGLPPSPTAPRP